MRRAYVCTLQAVAVGTLAYIFFGLGLGIRDGELAALVAGPSLITPTVYLLRSRPTG